MKRLIRGSIAALSIASLALVTVPITANANEPAVDTTPAVIQSITPADGALVSGTQTFIIKTDEWVAAYLEWNKGGTWKTDNTWAAGSTRYGSTTQLVVDTAKYGDGKFTLKVNLKNKAGLPTNATATYTVDNTKPSLSWVTPAENAYVRGTVPVTVTASDANPNAYNLRVDNAGLKYTAPWTSGDQTYSWNTTTIADGPHTLQATATDKAGNKVDPSIKRKLIVDNTKPNLTLPQNVLFGKATQTLHVTQDEANPAKTYVEIQQLVGGKWKKFTGQEYKDTNAFDFTVDPLALGLQENVPTQLKASTWDKAGNHTSATSKVVVDYTRPELVVDLPIEGTTVKSADVGSATVTASDSSGLTMGVANLYKDGTLFKSNVWRQNINDTSVSTTFDLPTELPNGEYELRVGTTDKAGNNRTVRVFFCVDNTVVEPEEPITEPEPQPEPPIEEETPDVTTPEEPEQETPVEEDTNVTTPVTEESAQEQKIVPAASLVSNPVVKAPAKTIAPLQLAATGASWVPAVSLISALFLAIGAMLIAAKRRVMV